MSPEHEPFALARLLRDTERLSQLQVAGLARIRPTRLASAESLALSLEVEEIERVAIALGVEALGSAGLFAPAPRALELLSALRARGFRS